MSPEKQRIKIALSLGARWYLLGSGWTWLSMKDLLFSSTAWKLVDAPNDISKVTIGESVPNHLSDLNACAAMEATLTTDECWLYNRALDEILGTAGGIGSGAIDQWKWHATAPQRCEAFLKCRNLWTP